MAVNMRVNTIFVLWGVIWSTMPGCGVPVKKFVRNTPTCMGKTNRRSLPIMPSGKHPHVHGEDKTEYGIMPPYEETPPRAWGRRARDTRAPSCTQKHPHVHGEDYPPGLYRGRLVETPPRAWGRPFPCRSSAPEPEKHPHVHGEDTKI